MISIGEGAVVLILVLLLMLLLDLGILSRIRLLEEEAQAIESFFQKDSACDLYAKKGIVKEGMPGREGECSGAGGQGRYK